MTDSKTPREDSIRLAAYMSQHGRPLESAMTFVPGLDPESPTDRAAVRKAAQKPIPLPSYPHSDYDPSNRPEVSKNPSVPGYREQSEAMLEKMKSLRRELPFRNLPSDKFNSLVTKAENAINRAKELESLAVNDKLARELYAYVCYEARIAVWDSYDAPLGIMGAAHSLTQRKKSDQRWAADEIQAEITAAINSLARTQEGHGDYVKPSKLWGSFAKLLRDQRIDISNPVPDIPLLDQYYEIDGREKPYTYEVFRTAISRERKKIST